MTTDADRRKVSGQGFSPTRHDADDETAPTTTHGSGKQFSPSVHDPEVNPEARQTEGSGKEFAPDVQQERDEDIPPGEGSGEQFEPRDRAD